MNFYETHQAKIEAKKPAQLNGKSAMEIVHYLQAHFKTDFIDDGQGFRQVPKNKATAYMIAVSKAIFDPSDWKAPCRTWFPECGDEWAKAAIVWYHGAEPICNGYWVHSRGYAC